MHKLNLGLLSFAMFICFIGNAQTEPPRNETPKGLPRNKQVAAAVAQKDVKTLTRLMVVDNDFEAHVTLRFYADKWGKRKEWEDALMAYLEHEDVVVVGNVAGYLGTMKCKRAVPSLIAVLNSTRNLRKRWTMTNGGVTDWGEHNARSRIIEALGEIGDSRAVTVLKTYLTSNTHGIYPGIAAHALYKIDGKRYGFTDHHGKEKLYEPPPKTPRRQKD